MNVLLVAMGSHGDVHPFIGIGLALRARGHRVSVIANAYFGPLIESLGLSFLAVGTAEEYRIMATNPALWRRFQGTRTVMASLSQTIRPLYDVVAQNNIPGETVVVASSLGLGARVAQDHLNIPTVTVHLQPSIFLSAVDPPRLGGIVTPKWFPLWLRRAQVAMVDRVCDPLVGPPLNALRHDLGMPPVRKIMTRYVHSPTRVIGMFPNWFAPPQSDWPSQTRLTGFPLYDERGATPLSDDLRRFLDAGDPPIAFTPGSAMWTGHEFLKESSRACDLLGRRGLLLTRHVEHLPKSLPPTVRHIDYAPFSELLPRCAALVHHGGIGTSAQALAAGIPQLLIPRAHDQPDNAARLIRMGVAEKAEPGRYKAPRVAMKLGELLNSPDVKTHCKEIASRFCGIDPIGETCELIEELVSTGKKPVLSS